MVGARWELATRWDWRLGANSSLTLSASAQSSLEPDRTLSCDHCREELGPSVHRYWHMKFCCSTCMSDYQRRLAPETQIKISRLESGGTRSTVCCVFRRSPVRDV